MQAVSNNADLEDSLDEDAFEILSAISPGADIYSECPSPQKLVS